MFLKREDICEQARNTFCQGCLEMTYWPCYVQVTLHQRSSCYLF